MNLQEIYLESNQWLKDLEFLDIERKFLRKIIKDYVTDSGLISGNMIERFNKQLFELEIEIHTLRDDVLTIQTKMDLMVKDLITGGRKEVKATYQTIRHRMDELFASFKRFKQELFQLANQIIEEEAID